MTIKNFVFSEIDDRIFSSFNEIKKFSNVFFISDSSDFKKTYSKLNKNEVPFISLDFNVFIKLKENSFDKLLDKIILININKDDFMSHFKLTNVDENPSLVYCLYLLKINRFDSYIGGAQYTSSTVLKNSLSIIGVKKNVKRVSSFFIMIKKFSDNDTQIAQLNDQNLIKSNPLDFLIFSDCAVQINPDYKQLKEIASLTINNATKIFKKLSVALLSYSTNSSGDGDDVIKVVKAYKLLKKSYLNKSNVDIDGPIQADAALSPIVRKQKKSLLKKNANVFIFPDLNSANISYKLVSYLANYYALGPILQGFKKNICDLSRGVTSQEIVLLCNYISKYSFD